MEASLILNLAKDTTCPVSTSPNGYSLGLMSSEGISYGPELKHNLPSTYSIGKLFVYLMKMAVSVLSIYTFKTAPSCCAGGGGYSLHKGNFWNIYATSIYTASYTTNGPLLLSNSGSFFWRCLLKLKPLFQSCAQFEIISGRQTSFWYDGWVGPAFATNRTGPLVRRAISVHDAKSCFHTLMPGLLTLHQHEAHRKISQFMPQQGSDKLVWTVSPSGTFTVRSIYAILAKGGRIRSMIISIWKEKVTPSIKFFFFFLNNRLLTHDVMQRRKMNYSPGCLMCLNCHSETVMHLFFQCPYAAQIWSILSMSAGYRLLSSTKTPTLTYLASTPRDKDRIRSWRVLFITGTWMIWRERNDRIFRQKTMPHHVLATRIQHEAALYLKYC